VNETASNRRLTFVLVETVHQFHLGQRGVEDLLGRTRTKTLARARQCAMAVMCDGFGMSSTEVGRFFERDHATVLHACSTVRSFPDYEQLLATVRAAFPGERRPKHLSTAQGALIHTNSQLRSVMHTPQIGPPGSSSPNSSDT